MVKLIGRVDLAFCYGPAAVDGEDLAGHELRLIGHEENRGLIEVFRSADAAAIERLFCRDEAHDFVIGDGTL